MTPSSEQILGVRFFVGTARDAVRRMTDGAGLLAAPASPALLNLKFDESYRRALQAADIVLPDSTLLVTLWKAISRRQLNKISGLSYLSCLLSTELLSGREVMFVVASEDAKAKAAAWLRSKGIAIGEESFHVATDVDAAGQDHELLLRAEERRPRHVIVALRAAAQEKLGLYLRDYLLYRPSIHCVGAALGFLTGAERPIPRWAERNQLGWLARLLSQPSMVLPRIGGAVTLTAAVLKHRSELPPLRARWSDR